MQCNPEIAELATRAGIVFPGAMDFLPRHLARDEQGREVPGKYAEHVDRKGAALAMDKMLAQDAATTVTYNQPSLVTSPNSAIPAMLSTYVDPAMIAVLLTPLKSEVIYGITKKGDWVTDTAMFGVVEMTGETSAYGDFNMSGRSDANVNWPQRQNALWQTFTEWGDRELERMALAKVDWAAQKNLSSANTLNRFANLINFFGWPNLQNYGGLNDPSLSAALTPATKADGGTSWQSALPTEILADIQAGYVQLQTQTPGNLELDDPFTLGIHPITETYLANTNQFGLTAMEMVRKVFPKIRIETAVQYLSGTTYSYQLILDRFPDGQRTCECAFSEKMRAHRIVTAESSYRQKKSAGGWGTIIYRPIGITSMAGI